MHTGTHSSTTPTLLTSSVTRSYSDVQQEKTTCDNQTDTNYSAFLYCLNAWLIETINHCCWPSIIWASLVMSILAEMLPPPHAFLTSIITLSCTDDNNHIERHNSRFLQSPHCAVNCLHHVCSSGPGAIMYKSRATHQALIMCSMSYATWYKGTAQLLSLTSLDHIDFSFMLLAEPFTDEGVEETRVPGENPWQWASKNVTNWSPKIQNLNPHSSIGGRLGKQTCRPLHHTLLLIQLTAHQVKSPAMTTALALLNQCLTQHTDALILPAIHQMKITYDDQYLITVGEDASILLWKIQDKEGRGLKRDKEVGWAEEILITKSDLEEKVRQLCVGCHSWPGCVV